MKLWHSADCVGESKSSCSLSASTCFSSSLCGRPVADAAWLPTVARASDATRLTAPSTAARLRGKGFTRITSLWPALVEAGIDRSLTYVTNAVKHFRFTPTPKRRLHQTPGPEHIAACRPWLDAELSLISPELVVVLGATAGRALLGSSFRITKQRGQLMPFESPGGGEDAGVHSAWIMATTHPSAVLRVPEQDRGAAYDALVADLRVGAQALA